MAKGPENNRQADDSTVHRRRWLDWLTIILPAGLLIAINYRQFPLLVEDWQNPNWSYGWLIPALSLYMLYVRRHELAATVRKIWPWGLILIAAGCAGQVFGYWIQNPLSCRLSMVLLIFSLVLTLSGPAITRLAWLPIFYLALAFPIPAIYYSRLAGPLQDMAAQGAGAILSIFGAQIEVAASSLTIITVSGQTQSLTVEEACAGMRLLAAFLALSVAMAYLADRRLWQKITLVLLGIPVAIVCNIIRVTITCVMFLFDKPEMGKGFMHEFAGYLMLVPAFLLLWLADKLLRGLVVEVEEPDDKTKEVKDAAVPVQTDTPGQKTERTVTYNSTKGIPASVTLGAIVVLLTATAVGANLSQWTRRLPVTWPTGTVVRENFSLASMPNRFGPFVEVDTDITGDGKPDGEIFPDESELELLGIGNGRDRNLYKSRLSNWYSCRIFRDERITDPVSPYKYWRLEIYYYTGIRDVVPHVPERCLAAAGAKITGSSEITSAVDLIGWADQVQLRKTIFVESPGKSLLSRTFSQYYVFSLNGRFEKSWEKVRIGISLPWVRRSYFAKIQFAPLGNSVDVRRADEKAVEFAGFALPAALANLPTEADVEKQDKSSPDEGN